MEKLNATAVSHIFNRAIGHKCELSMSMNITEKEIFEAKEQFKNFVKYYNNKNLNSQQIIYKDFINTLLVMLDNYEFTKDKTEIDNYIHNNCLVMLTEI